MKKQFSPHEIKAVLQALAQTGAVIIGGQAVNLWAERYQNESPPWQELRPYTSFDLDVLGDRTDVLKCSQALDAEPFFPLPSENTANSGKIVTKLGGEDFEIDFLHSPSGLSPAEVTELARTITFEGIPVKIPSAALRGKQNGQSGDSPARRGGPAGPQAPAPFHRELASTSLKVNLGRRLRAAALALGAPDTHERKSRVGASGRHKTRHQFSRGDPGGPLANPSGATRRFRQDGMARMER